MQRATFCPLRSVHASPSSIGIPVPMFTLPCGVHGRAIVAWRPISRETAADGSNESLKARCYTGSLESTRVAELRGNSFESATIVPEYRRRAVFDVDHARVPR